MRQYFDFRSEYTYCALVVALSEKTSTIRYMAIENVELVHDYFPEHSRM